MTDTPKDNTPDNSQAGKLTENMKKNLIHGVGYKRPPEESQFKKGQSGNPGGRPKKKDKEKSSDLLPIVKAILSEADKPIAVREGDDVAEMSIYQAVFKAMSAQALKGSVYAQKQFIEVVSKCQKLQAEEITEQTEFWFDYIKYWHREMNAPRADNEQPPQLFPHPDDIVFERGKAPRFTGPMSKEAADDMDRTCRLRDALLMQSALENRLNNVVDHTDGQHVLTTPMFAATVINDNLPDRFKLDDVDLFLQLSSFNRLTKRQLLKEVRAEWKSLGVTVRRGFVFIPLDEFVVKMNFMLDALNAMMSGQLDAKAISRGQYDEGVWDFIDRHKAA